MIIRKNQSTLTAAEKQAFVQAVLKLKNNTPSQMGMSYRYDDFVMMHMEAMMAHPNYAHSGPTFLPWHACAGRRPNDDRRAI